MDSSRPSQESPTEPQRLSALYQFHNAPEVAPVHGLEYDDTIYPTSDKYPVVREHPAVYDKYGRYDAHNDNRPPRIIFGMKVPTFLVVALVMALVIVGAAVGGAVGGQQLRSAGVTDGSGTGMLNNVTVTQSASPVSSAAPTSTSTFSAPTPTFTPLSDCPASNNTGYTSSFALGASGSVPASAALNFTKYCNVANPLAMSGAHNLVEAFVYTFSDCVEICAGYNFLHNGANCTAAAYQANGTRPANCWVGDTGSIMTFSQLNSSTQAIDVALVLPPSS